MNARNAVMPLLVALLALGSLGNALGAEYRSVNPKASKIDFNYKQTGSRVYGTFGEFEATLDFDTARIGAAHTEISIKLDSVDAGSPDATNELKTPDWFNTEVFPMARFESSKITALGDERYRVEGRLTLKGVTRDIEAEMSLKAESGIGVFNGQFVLKRDDFKIGTGSWANGMVSNEINIHFRVVAPEQ